MNPLERMIGAVAPRIALRRAVAREKLAQLGRLQDRVRRYEGADRGRRTAGWTSVDVSPSAATRGALHELRARCRDLRRNNAHASTAVRELTANLIGRGIRPTFEHEREAELKNALEVWEEWATTPQADAAGRETFFGMQAAAAEGMIDGGEHLVRRRQRRPDDELVVPLQVQLLEGDHLDTLRDEAPDRNGNEIVQGVQFNAIGQREGYWLHRRHPGDQWGTAGMTPSVFVPAPEVRHVFRSERTGQVRGVGWAAPVILLLHDFDEYSDFEQLRMKAATALAGFVHDLSGEGVGAADSLLGQAQTNALGQPVDTIEGGTIEELAPGKTVTFTTPPQNEGFPAFATVQLRAVARAYGVPYWLLTGDLSAVSFSSIRGDWVAFQAFLSMIRDRVLIPHLCEPVARWWRDAAELVDVLTPGEENPRRLRWRWIPPRREMLDPRTEVMAELEAVRAGFKSLREVVESLGSDPRRVIDELADDLKRAKAAGLTLTVDGANAAPGKVASVNAQKAKPGSNGNGKPADEEKALEDRIFRELAVACRMKGVGTAELLATLLGP